MPAPTTPVPWPPRRSAGPPGRTGLGLLLVAPAALALLVGYVWPTLQTIWNSFRSYSRLDQEREWVGLDNYERLADGPPAGFGLALVTALGLLVILLAVAPLLAWLAFRAGSGLRIATRLLLTLPMVALAPAAIATSWGLDREQRLLLADFPDRFIDPDQAPFSLTMVTWLAAFGLVCGLGVTCYLAALRGRRPGGSAWPAGLTVAGLAGLAAVAVALQSFTYPVTLVGTGGLTESISPMVHTFSLAYLVFEPGVASASATLVLVPLLLLGLAAGVLVAATRLRVEVETGWSAATGPAGWDTGRVLALFGAVVGLVVVTGVTGYGLWPWLSRLGQTGEGDIGSLLVHTWLPPLISTVVGVGLAAIAGFGIGALRPLGDHSEWLLLPFAPWLFIGIGPLNLIKFESILDGGRIGTFLSYVPPIWLVVPALFMLTLVFRGLAGQRRAKAGGGADPGLSFVLLRALPMLGLVGLATWVVQAQSLLWGWLVSRDHYTLPVWMVFQRGNRGSDLEVVGVGLPLPIPVLALLVIGLAVLQLFYLDRLALRVGRADRPPRQVRHTGHDDP